MRLSAAQLKRAYLVILALRWLPVGVAVALSVLVMMDRGLDLAQVGLLYGAHGVTVAVLELPTGGLADVIGRRPVVVLSAALFLAAATIFLLADSFAAFLASMIVMGTARSLDSGPLEAWFVDEALLLDPDRDLEHDLSRAGTVLSAALAAGSLLAGGLGFAAARGWLGSVDPLVAPLVAAVAVHALHVLAAAMLMEEHRERRSLREAVASFTTVPATILGAAGNVWRAPGLRSIVAIELLWGLSLAPVERLWQPRTAELVGGAKDDVALFGVLSAGAWVASALGAYFLPTLSRGLGSSTERAAIVVKVFQAGAIVGMAAAGGVWIFAVAYLLTYVGNGASSPAHMSLLHRRAAGTPRATLLSVHSLCGQGGGFLGSVGLLALAGVAGIPLALLVCAAVLLVSAPLYLVRDRASEVPAQDSLATSIADA